VSVNFHPDLHTLMLEARYLDRQCFEIPPVALQVGEQAGDLDGGEGRGGGQLPCR
jgi:hypothetical protein